MSYDLKKKILAALEANDLAAAAELAAGDRKAVSQLIRISYDKDTLAGWRAVLAAGLAARKLAGTDRNFLRETCRKLLWSLSDESGGIGWSAPELLGEIVSADPAGLREFIPLIATVFGIEEKVFRAGAVYALYRIAGADPAPVLEHHEVMLAALAEPEPATRIRGLQLAGILAPAAGKEGRWPADITDKLKAAVERCRGDLGEAWIYGESGFISVTVKEMAISISI